MTIAAALLPDFAKAQSKLTFDVKSSCHFYPSDEISDTIYSFGSSQEALDIVKRVTNAVGLEPNFELQETNIPNAIAIINGDKRYILYSLLFIQQMEAETASAWAARTILAHEVGHHLNGHTLTKSGSRPLLELEADRFAGRAVKLMGGSLDQALAAYQVMPPQGTDTHPPRSARLEAVTRGWTTDAALAAAIGPQAASKDKDALAKEIVESLRSGAPPYARMSPDLFASVKADTDGSLAKLKSARTSSSIEEQGKQIAADGDLYYLYGIQNGESNLSCVIGLTRNGILQSFHCQ
jgi:Zn-dependent protease with chaperone function